MNKFRKIPPVCLFVASAQLLTGRLRLSDKYLGTEVRNENGNAFKVFRNIKSDMNGKSREGCVFVVSFKFAHFSHKVNKVVSVIPMLLIAGFPGFRQKLYAVNEQSGYWQGIYEWRSEVHLEEYKKSFVFRMMNKRAVKGSVNSFQVINSQLDEFIKQYTLNSI